MMTQNGRIENRKRLRSALEGQGQRFTRQRARVYEVLCGTDQHPTAEEVYQRVRQSIRSVSLATVYKSLEALVACGLARKLNNGNASARYDATVSSHPHLRDLKTDRVLDVPATVASQLNLALPSETVAAIAAQTGFEVTGMQVELVGYQRQSP